MISLGERAWIDVGGEKNRDGMISLGRIGLNVVMTTYYSRISTVCTTEVVLTR